MCFYLILLESLSFPYLHIWSQPDISCQGQKYPILEQDRKSPEYIEPKTDVLFLYALEVHTYVLNTLNIADSFLSIPKWRKCVHKY